MNAICTSCQTVFRVDPAKVPVAGVRARCSVCNGVFWVRRPEPVVPVPAVRVEAPVATAPPVVPRAAQPVLRTPAIGPPVVAPPVAERAMPPAPAISFAPPAAPPAQRPAVPPSQAPASTPAPPPRAPVAPAFAPPPGLGLPAARPTPTVSAVAPLPAPPARPVVKPRMNPFMSQDPAAKARRLARALISDMVVYHPAKRREGLQNGSLKTLFDEEIKKSWEEYVDQVGREAAESTPFFHEALNEILADGRAIFP